MHADRDASLQHAERDALPVHGGDLAAVARRYGVPQDELLDFSANLNPLGPPQILLDELAAGAGDIGELGRYPEPDAATLRRTLAVHHDVDPASVVVANGAAALISIAARVAMRERCLVPVPAFSEDAHALRAAGIELIPVALDAARGFALPVERIGGMLRARAAAACLITTPHNPSGALVPQATVAELLAHARPSEATLVIDEAFVDFVPEESSIRLAATAPRTIVVRSLTKFFAVPALRVGFAVCEPLLAARLRAVLPSWPVTTLAMRALGAALDDADYARRTCATIARERAAMLDGLRALPLRFFPSAANFLLLELTEGRSSARLVRDLVVNDRIVIRDCSSYAGLTPDRYVRVAVRGAAENGRLLAALHRALS